MLKPRTFLIFVLALLLIAGLWWARTHVAFDWHNLRLQLRTVRWSFVLAGCAVIYLSMTFRAWRWQLLLGSEGRNSSGAKLVAAQFAGFTAVALFGRVADLTRPYLLARRTQTSVATQLAVYSLERAYDLAAAAILFSTTLLFMPRTVPHHEYYVRAGVVAMAGTLFLVGFALAVRFTGMQLASMARGVFRIVSQEFANGVAVKLLDFRQGMLALSSAMQLFAALLWSLAIWALIAAAYFLTARAFVNTAQLAGFTIASTMLLMATSMGGSLFQLPIVGWFTQTGVLAVALHKFFDVPLEVATAAGALMLLTTTLSVVPAGVMAARIEGVSLRTAAQAGEAAAEVS
ncbi:lysylphosphatidylglycerol synthase transmembrane domain-containing protein [Granulicella cerasi]|uniref:Lysylphosphatidylglycerol synthase transmembrane domain-containing protein n=1 Tax=Granulicella cerasi TaxID=741063 RepID=A0ABW1Z6V1_9BACT|nr:lysylphosphatidylglycerol synthase transmembrane domain-containing protein [Granulicella cerasi]